MEAKNEATETELSRMYQVLSLACCPLLLMGPQIRKEVGEKEPLLPKPEEGKDIKSLT